MPTNNANVTPAFTHQINLNTKINLKKPDERLDERKQNQGEFKSSSTKNPLCTDNQGK